MTIWMPDISSSSDPIYLAIAKAIVADVTAGRLKPGERLPPQRELARLLHVSIGTVTKGYVEASRRGVTRGASRRGTVVRKPDEEDDDSRIWFGPKGQIVDLGTNIPIRGEDPDFSTALADLAQERDLSRLLHYQAPQEDPRYLAAGAKWIGECGVEVDPRAVVITAGVQHAMMVTLAALTKPGDVVFTDALTSVGLLSVARLLHLRVQGIEMDDEGMRPDALLSACRQRNGQVLYCMPTVHNPTSATLPADSREELAEVAREHDLLIIENEVHRHLAPDAALPISQIAPERGLLITGLSKAVAPGLRVGYVAVPPFARDRVNDAICASLVMVGPLTLELATRWIEDGIARRTANRKRAEAEARQGIAREVLAGHAFRSSPASYSIFLELPGEWRAGEFADEARRRGVATAPAAAFVVPGCPRPEAVRISLSGAADKGQLRNALEILAKILAEASPGQSIRF